MLILWDLECLVVYLMLILLVNYLGIWWKEESYESMRKKVRFKYMKKDNISKNLKREDEENERN